MRTVDDFAAIRRAHRDGLSIRQIAKQLAVGRDTVRKALVHPEPPPYTLAQPRPAPVFGRFRDVVDAILAADETAPKKQRHTASQVYRRLVAEYGYAGELRPDPPPPEGPPALSAADVHPAGPPAGAPGRGRLRPHLCRLPRRPPPGPGPARHLELLERPVRHRLADRADRGRPARPGRGVRLLRLRPD